MDGLIHRSIFIAWVAVCSSDCLRVPAMCGSNVLGGLEDNVLASVPDIGSQAECQELCVDTPACSFYTYLLATDPLRPLSCLLLSSVLAPALPRDTAVSGPRICSSSCSLEWRGETYQVELSTNLRQVSQCPEKASTRAYFS